MRHELPLTDGARLVGSPAQGEVERGHEAAGRSRVFGLIRYKTVGYLTGALDYVLILTACIVAGAAYHSLILQGNVPDLMPYIGLGNIVAALFVLGTASRGNYHPSRIVQARLQVRSIVVFWSLALLTLALFLFLAKSGPYFSRGTILLFGVLGFALLCSTHVWISATLKDALSRGVLAGDRAITIGDREAMTELSQASILWKSGAREIRRFLLPTETGNDDAADLRLIDEAISFTRSSGADCVLLALQWSDERRRNAICERLQALPIPVLLLPDRHVDAIFAQGQKLGRDFTVEIQRAPLSESELVLKRVLDVVVASGLIVALIPLFVMVGLLIKLESRGPVIFRQRRKGFNGREFAIFKFRTMNVLEDGRVIQQARRGDPRVTRIGRVLRAASIDELPQLINVLQGHMSLVGPRPHALAHDDGYTKVIAKYAFRQHVKPGLTGWAQVNGFRGETARLEQMERRVECDLWYIKNWSIWLDLKILVLTSFEVLRRRNAY